MVNACSNRNPTSVVSFSSLFVFNLTINCSKTGPKRQPQRGIRVFKKTKKLKQSFHPIVCVKVR